MDKNTGGIKFLLMNERGAVCIIEGKNVETLGQSEHISCDKLVTLKRVQTSETKSPCALKVLRPVEKEKPKQCPRFLPQQEPRSVPKDDVVKKKHVEKHNNEVKILVPKKRIENIRSKTKLTKIKYQCDNCSKYFFSKKWIEKHILHKCVNSVATNSRFCTTCKLHFTLSASQFYRHRSTCSKSKRKSIKCGVQNCEDLFHRYFYMIKHMQQHHGLNISEEIHTFQNNQEFKLWKEKIELETLSYFPAMSGGNKRGSKTYMAYFCQFNMRNNTRKNQRPVKYRKETAPQLSCPARMTVVWQQNGSLEIKFMAYHNHELQFENCKFQPYPESIRQEITQKLSQNIPPKQILAEIKAKRNKDGTLNKLDMISLKYIFNMKHKLLIDGQNNKENRTKKRRSNKNFNNIVERSILDTEVVQSSSKSHAEAASAVQNLNCNFNGHEEIVINWHEDVREEFVVQDDVGSTLVAECLSYLENITTVVRDTSTVPDLLSHIYTTLRDLDTYCNTHLTHITIPELPHSQHTSFAEFMSQIPDFNVPITQPKQASEFMHGVLEFNTEIQNLGQECNPKEVLEGKKPKRTRKRKHQVAEEIVKTIAPHIANINAINPLLHAKEKAIPSEVPDWQQDKKKRKIKQRSNKKVAQINANNLLLSDKGNLKQISDIETPNIGNQKVVVKSIENFTPNNFQVVASSSNPLMSCLEQNDSNKIPDKTPNKKRKLKQKNVKPVKKINTIKSASNQTPVTIMSRKQISENAEASQAEVVHDDCVSNMDTIVDAYLAAKTKNMTKVKFTTCSDVVCILKQESTLDIRKKLKHGKCDLILLPLKIDNQNWSLAVYYTFNNTIRYIDPALVPVPNREQVAHIIAKFLAQTFDCSVPTIDYPQCCKKKNEISSDVYLCHFVKVALDCQSFELPFHLSEISQELAILLQKE